MEGGEAFGVACTGGAAAGEEASGAFGYHHSGACWDSAASPSTRTAQHLAGKDVGLCSAAFGARVHSAALCVLHLSRGDKRMKCNRVLPCAGLYTEALHDTPVPLPPTLPSAPPVRPPPNTEHGSEVVAVRVHPHDDTGPTVYEKSGRDGEQGGASGRKVVLGAPQEVYGGPRPKP